MKRNLLVFLVTASLVLSFSNAFAGGPVPQFGITTEGIKLGDLRANTWRSGLHGLIVDGSNVYAVRIGGLFSEKEVVMDKSNDSGLTWLNSTGIARGSEIEVGYEPTIAINPVTKALHYAWCTNEPLVTPSSNLYYGNGTITTRANASVEVSNGSSSVDVDKYGIIHIVFVGSGGIYYTSSSDDGMTFSEPAAIPVVPGYYGGNWISFDADGDGNLFLVYMSYDGYMWHNYFMKKLYGGVWSGSSDACPGSICMGSDPSMAVYDSNKIYIASGGTIAATFNGGQTWTQYNTAGYGTNESSLAVDSNGLLNLAWEGPNHNDIYFARTTKSHDPSSWGQAVLALPGGQLPNVAVDSAGKAYIMAGKGNIATFTKEK